MMTIKEAQEIVKREGIAWKVRKVEEVKMFHILIYCVWTINAVEEKRYIYYSTITNNILKIMLPTEYDTMKHYTQL